MINSLKLFQLLAAPLSIESSIRMAKNRLSSFRQSVTGVRSLPKESWTSPLDMAGTLSLLFDTAVTVKVTGAEAAAGDWARPNPAQIRNATPKQKPAKLRLRVCFICNLRFLSFDLN
jgi:hypothetical protein